jgi:methionyl aminopeptidase
VIPLKTTAELELMREAGRVVAGCLAELRRQVAPGVRTIDLDRAAERFIRSSGGKPAFKGYRGYPASICVSVNSQVVHGIPGPLRLADGDVVSLDVGVALQGYHADAATTVLAGRAGSAAKRLVAVTEEALAKAIACVQPGRRVSDISHAVQTYVELAGFGVVREYGGHGIGRDMHEEPQIPNFGPPACGPLLRPGMVLALEPMVNAGGPDVRLLEDGWTVVTMDGSLSAHFEHTVAVTVDGPEILTGPLDRAQSTMI